MQLSPHRSSRCQRAGYSGPLARPGAASSTTSTRWPATSASEASQWRPHAKAFKCPAIAHILRRAGAIGVTVAKVSEAEVMAAGGINDILIAHLVVGPSKLARLAALQNRPTSRSRSTTPTTWPN